MMFKKFFWMFKKDLLSLWRHKPRLISLFIFPILMIALFGYGMGGSIENVPIAIVEQSHGNITDSTLMAIKDMSLFDVKNITTDVEAGKELVDDGSVKATIILPSNYENISDSSAKTVVLYLDSSDQIASQTIVPTTQGLFTKIGSLIGMEKLSSISLQTQAISKDSSGSSSGASASNSSSTTVDDGSNTNDGSSDSSNSFGLSSSLSNELTSITNTINLQVNRIYGDIEYIDFLVPAILAMTIMMSCMMGMGQSIAGERETGELIRLFMTPTSISTVVGGKIASKLIIETIRAMILLVTAVVLFNITINGSWILAVVMMVIGALTFVGFGIMVSATSSTQEDYTQMVMPFTMPMMFVSGVFYPVETMPWIFQKIAYICPLTYFNDAMRGIMLKGAGLGDIWIDVAVLLGFTVVFFALGVVRFNRDA
ncbi:ABC transporter permease [Methanobrevibacter curvatus]|uniref:Inner membrane transport permease YbhR n=1 Tax=Methanobrevibacter curvatus TaxID=49547 RepID=A0A166DHH6_9EURY|nr:inner membrane transport permease YbhR [Methanobrevibacter curvatus]